MTTNTILTSEQRHTFYRACYEIIKAGGDPKQINQVNYAVNYAKAGKRMILSDEIITQGLYILNNIQYWRGEVAKQVRADLKQITGAK